MVFSLQMNRRMLNARPKLIIVLCCIAVGFTSLWSQPLHNVKNLPAGENVLWSNPGNVSSLDFVTGIGGSRMEPRAPFTFLSEDFSGANPKIKVRDKRGVTWSVKFGPEAKPSVFSTRVVWACGYNVEIEYFVGHGQVIGARRLKRAAHFIQGDGSFTDARFQARVANPKFLETSNWSWTSNPFVGSPQLSGLKILVMLLSNWDTKDARDSDPSSGSVLADSNLGVFQTRGVRGPKYLFMMTDWGSTMGAWGTLGVRSRFNCRGYSRQTPNFVEGVENGLVKWGFSGKHTGDIVSGIRISDVQWLLQYLGRITDSQIRRGLAASGATPDEMGCFLTAIRQRIDELQNVARTETSSR